MDYYLVISHLTRYLCTKVRKTIDIIPNLMAPTTATPRHQLLPPPTVALSHETLRERIIGGGGGTVSARGSLAKVASRYADLLHLLKDESSPTSSSATSTIIYTPPMTKTTTMTTNIDVAKRAFDTELRLYDLEVRKLALSARASNVNSALSAGTQSRLESTLIRVRQEVTRLTDQLSQERASKRRREEYDTLAKLGSIVGWVGGGGGGEHNEEHNNANNNQQRRRQQQQQHNPRPPLLTTPSPSIQGSSSSSLSFPPVRTTRMELETIQNEITNVTQDVNKLKYELRVKESQLRVVMTSLVDLGSTWTEEHEEDIKKEEGEVAAEK